MKKLLLILLLIPIEAHSQHSYSESAYSSSLGRVETFATVDGRPFFPKQYTDVNGTPNLFEEFAASKIVLNDGKIIDNIKTNFNLVTNELIYLDEQGKTMVASASTIKMVEVGPRKFITTAARNTYFELISQEGKATLLKYTRKVIMETKPYNSATIQKDFRTRESYMLRIDGELAEVKTLKDLYKSLLPSGPLKDFAKKEKLKQKSVDSWVKIVEYYNSI